MTISWTLLLEQNNSLSPALDLIFHLLYSYNGLLTLGGAIVLFFVCTLCFYRRAPSPPVKHAQAPVQSQTQAQTQAQTQSTLLSPLLQSPPLAYEMQPMQTMQPMQLMSPMQQPMQTMQLMSPMQQPMQTMQPMQLMSPMQPMQTMQPMQLMSPMQPIQTMQLTHAYASPDPYQSRYPATDVAPLTTYPVNNGPIPRMPARVSAQALEGYYRPLPSTPIEPNSVFTRIA